MTRPSSRLLWLVSIAVTAAICTVAYSRLISPQDVFMWDEASYAHRALASLADLEANDFFGFVRRVGTPEMMTYGFLHSWVEALAFRLFGVSYSVARGLSMACFALSLLCIVQIGARLDRRWGVWPGAIAAALMAASPVMWRWAASNMIEPLCMVLVLLAFLFFFIGLDTHAPSAFFAAGVAIGLTFLAKHNAGGLLLAGFCASAVLELLLPARRRVADRAVIAAQFGLMLAAAAAVLSLWLTQVDLREQLSRFRWELFDQFADIEEAARVAGTTQSLPIKLWAYAQDIPRQYSPGLVGYGVLLLTGCAVAFAGRMKVRALLVFVGISWIATSSMPLLQSRYIMTMMGPVYVLAGYAAVAILGRLRGTRAPRLAYGVALAIWAIVFVRDLPTVFARARATAFAGTSASVPVIPDGRLIDMLEFFRHQLPADAGFATIVRTGYLSPYVWRFHFHGSQGAHLTSDEFDTAAFLKQRYFLTVEVRVGCPYFHEIKNENRLDNLAIWNWYLRQRLTAGSVRVAAEKNFPRLAMKALVYENVLGGSAVQPPLPDFLPPMVKSPAAGP